MRWVFEFPYARDYDKLGRVEPGDIVEADEAPDNLYWSPAPASAPAPVREETEEVTDLQEAVEEAEAALDAAKAAEAATIGTPPLRADATDDNEGES
jgi:hypothetical protein